MTKEEIDKIIEQAARETGYIIYNSSIYLKGENSKISVKIDSLKGISHKDCEEYSKELADRLDDSEILANYSLEISSPGLHRELRTIDELTRFIGSPVKVIYEFEGKRDVFKGIIKDIDNEDIILKIEDNEIKILFKNIINANLDY